MDSTFEQSALSRASPFTLSVEEENLASIPFAVLEQRVGKRTNKLEVSGTKTLPDGAEVQTTWQVQGNNELGLPTEQDMDIFVALGVLTFRNNFAKTVTFSGRELAKILNIQSVNGRFYERLKIAMDRFIPLRFRTLTSSDRWEDVSWVNVFQDASFSLDRKTGRCLGTVTWTDRIIESMDNGFFRVLDARRYMELDGLTTKHMYRFLAIAFEHQDVVIIDARQLATRHLGIAKLPAYFSRLLQTIEPALEQLHRREIVGSWYVVSKEEWRIAIRVHARYIPQRRTLTLPVANDPEAQRNRCRHILERTGFSLTEPTVAALVEGTLDPKTLYGLERLAHLMDRLIEEEILPHVVQAIGRQVLDMGSGTAAGRDQLDWIEIAVNVCTLKKRSRQKLRNAAGLIVTLIRDEASRVRLVTREQIDTMKSSFRRREEASLRQEQEVEERALVLEYEQYREAHARILFDRMAEEQRSVLAHQKLAAMRHDERWSRLSVGQQLGEAEMQVMMDLAKEAVAPFQKWRLRRIAGQVALSLFMPETPVEEAVI